MGVSVVAYSHMELLHPHEEDYECQETHTHAFVLQGFEQSLRGLAADRCYVESSETQELRVMDRSYSGYGRWREELCRAVYGFAPGVIWHDPEKYRDRPLFELINFADNEGCIGPDAARDLLEDFKANAKQLAHIAHYDDWLEGLELAADGGLIQYR